MRENIIEARNLVKTYGDVSALSGISFDIRKGQTAAFLGPNGAGKSSLINILSTALKPDGGDVLIKGMPLSGNLKKIRKEIGVVFQSSILDEEFTVCENLRMRGRLYALKGRKLEESLRQAAEIAGIENLMHRYYGKLSGGQKRRCDIARALIHSPEILILDEPTSGLDPEIRHEILETLASIKRSAGMTIVMTTHYMQEAAAADHIVVIKGGLSVFDGTPYGITDRFSEDRLILYSGDKIKTIPLSKTTDALNILEIQQGRYESFEVLRGSMDAAYLSVIEKTDCETEKGDCYA